MKIAYFNCVGGVSGDMILAAMIDAGLPLEVLNKELSKLQLRGYEIDTESAINGAISGTKVTIRLETTLAHQVHRSLQDVLDIISNSALKAETKEKSCAIFNNLAIAEAKVHQTSTDKVLFHEVGAVDAILDIVGASIGFKWLGIDTAYCSPIPAGSGVIKTSHGKLPVPAPATLELLAMNTAPLSEPIPGITPRAELSTPTGVAVLTTLAKFKQPAMTLDRIGYGIGHKNLGDYPNVLGLWLSTNGTSDNNRLLDLLETNIDDMNPEIYPYLMERLFKLGVRDVWLTPIQMKKGRPAIMVSVIANPEEKNAVATMLMEETSTLGVRSTKIIRYESERKTVEIETSLGTVRVKNKFKDGSKVTSTPEYEDCVRIARELGIPLLDVYRVVAKEANYGS